MLHRHDWRLFVEGTSEETYKCAVPGCDALKFVERHPPESRLRRLFRWLARVCRRTLTH